MLTRRNNYIGAVLFITAAVFILRVNTAHAWQAACNNSFTGQVYDQSTNQPLIGTEVKMIVKGLIPTEEECATYPSEDGYGDHIFCNPGGSAGYVATTDENGFHFQIFAQQRNNFTVQIFKDGYVSSTESYADIYNGSGVDCYGDLHHDLYLEPNNKRIPIVIVPGIMGSYLFDYDNYEVWPNIPLMVISKDDSYLEELALSADGISDTNSAVSQIKATDILRNLYGHDFFGGLIDELKNSGYLEGQDLFVAPYDWRLDVDLSSVSLSKIITDVQTQTGAEKVDIIAHSMGGLVVKRYIEKYGNVNIDKFIDIASPHFGAPKAFKILSYGDNLDIKILNTSLIDTAILNTSTIQQISQNMPAIYQLLPSRKYFDNTSQDYNGYIFDFNDMDNNGVKGNLDYDQSIEFMKNTGRNDYLLAKNDELHNEIDNFDPTAYGIQAYNIIGCGQPTVSKVYVLNKEKNGWEYGLRYTSGDGTVPMRSAEGLINPLETYFATGAEHSALPSYTGVKQLVAAIENNQENNFDYSQYSNISQNNNACALNGWEISYHSPITLNIYDENNNHLGPNENGDIEMNIAGASYDIIDNNKFAFLPKGHTYRITGQATDSGTFNARVQNIQNNETTQTQYFNSVPLDSTATNVEYNLDDQTENVAMNIDEDGDQVFEQTIEPSAVLDQVGSQDVTKPQTSVVVDGTLGQNNWYVSTTTIVLTGQDEENGSGILKTEYSLDNGATWQIYTEPIVLSDDGVYNIWYKSTDRAGNIEIEKEMNVDIDKTAPTMDIFSPLNNSKYLRSENLDAVYDINDAESGIATDTIKIFVDKVEISSTAVKLFDYSLGAHSLSISVKDLAGNVASTTVSFNVTTNIDSTISDVNTLYTIGAINDKADKQLTNDFKLIKMQIEKFGQKKIIIDNKFVEAINKCTAKRGVDWCNAKLKPHLDRTEYTLNKIYKAIITLQYQLVIAELKQFNKKLWINLRAYDVLSEDVNYLINELK